MKFDAKVRDTAEQILGRPMPDEVYAQATLTPKLGGLGLRLTVEHADLAYAASFHESQSTAREVWVCPPGVPASASSQKFASFKFDEIKLSGLLASAPNDREFQRLSRCAQPHACGFLTTVPSCDDGYDAVLAPRNFRTAVLYPKVPPAPCACSPLMFTAITPFAALRKAISSDVTTVCATSSIQLPLMVC